MGLDSNSNKVKQQEARIDREKYNENWKENDNGKLQTKKQTCRWVVAIFSCSNDNGHIMSFSLEGDEARVDGEK